MYIRMLSNFTLSWCRWCDVSIPRRFEPFSGWHIFKQTVSLCERFFQTPNTCSQPPTDILSLYVIFSSFACVSLSQVCPFLSPQETWLCVHASLLANSSINHWANFNHLLRVRYPNLQIVIFWRFMMAAIREDKNLYYLVNLKDLRSDLVW